MKVRVEACYGSRFYFRLTLPDGSRERITTDETGWNRSTAREALNLLQSVYGLPRKKIRFVVH